jgi:hypothetical protein
MKSDSYSIYYEWLFYESLIAGLKNSFRFAKANWKVYLFINFQIIHFYPFLNQF